MQKTIFPTQKAQILYHPTVACTPGASKACNLAHDDMRDQPGAGFLQLVYLLSLPVPG